jgi:hypothetical protein
MSLGGEVLQGCGCASNHTDVYICITLCLLKP